MSKSKRGPGRPRQYAVGERKPAHIVYARLPIRLGEALERYRQSVQPKPTATAVIEFILEQFLREKGFWPPKD